MSGTTLSFVLQSIRPEFLAKAPLNPLPKPESDNEGKNWSQIFDTAERLHAALPLALSLSKSAWFEELPEAVRLRVDERIQREKMILAILDHELDSALFLLMSAKIPVMVLKGMDWGRRYYPERLLRPISDLNLLLHPNDMENALRVLSYGGYKAPSAEVSKSSPTSLVRLKGGPALCLHPYLMAGETGTETQQLWQRSCENCLPGIPSHTHALSHEDNLIFLIRLCTARSLLETPIWLNDLHFLIEKQDFQENADWEWLLWYFAHHSLTSSAWFVLNFLATYSNTAIPKENLQTLGEQIGPLKKHLLARLTNPEAWFAQANRSWPWMVRSQLLVQENPIEALKQSLTRRPPLWQSGV